MTPSRTQNFKQALGRWASGGFIPASSYGREWFFMRLLMALLVCYSLLEFKPFGFDGQPVPRGLAHFFDLTFLSHQGPVDLSGWGKRIEVPMLGAIRIHGPGWYDTIFLSSLVLGALYVRGRGLLVTLPLLALVHTLPWTLSNSQGFTHHGLQLVSMVLIVQSVVVWWWQVRRWRGGPSLELPLRSYLIYYSQGMVAFSYVTCAVSKLINSKGLWLFKSNNICIEIIKSFRLDYYANLDPAVAGQPPAALWLLHHPMFTRLVFDTGFFIELLAFVALRSRGWALFTGLTIIVFHRSVWWLMRLEFPMHEWLLLIFLVNVPYWLERLSQRARGPLLSAKASP